jgi:hypothetical protein
VVGCGDIDLDQIERSCMAEASEQQICLFRMECPNVGVIGRSDKIPQRSDTELIQINSVRCALGIFVPPVTIFADAIVMGRAARYGGNASPFSALSPPKIASKHRAARSPALFQTSLDDAPSRK